MFPRSAVQDGLHRCMFDAILSSKRTMAVFAGRVLGADFAHILCGQTTLGQGISPRMSVLRSRIGHIILLGSQKEMVGADARWVVAPMADRQPFRQRLIVEFIRKAMRARVKEVAVSMFVFACSPKPAPIGFLNLSPKTIRARRDLSRLLMQAGAFSAAKVAVSFSDVLGRWLESAPAMIACGRIGVHIESPSMCHATGGLQPRRGFVMP